MNDFDRHIQDLLIDDADILSKNMKQDLKNPY